MSSPHPLLTDDTPLVTTEWLASHLGDARLRVVDIRGKVLPPAHPQPRYLPKRAEYDAGHVPGAAFVDWTKDIVDTADPIPAQLALAEPFARFMESIGVGDDTLVVAYDDYASVFASRLVWALRYYGHEAARVLDGGFPLWTAEGRPVATDAPAFDPAAFRFTAAPRPGLRRTADEVERALGSDKIVLVDARAKEQWEGKASAASRKGHVPGARNVHYAGLVDPHTGKFKSRDVLREIFLASGVDVDGPRCNVIAYCNGGLTACGALTALRIVGKGDAALYDGSWNEWGNDPRRPIEVT